MSKPDDEVPFLARWSRMKRRAGGTREPANNVEPNELDGSSPPASESASLAVERTAAHADPVGQAGVEPPLDLEQLPRVDELTAESDIAAFLDRRVPAALRNAALARIWTLDPTIRDFIEVAENQWNWNIPGGAPFYEVIEEGSTAGITFADATSAIARTLTAPDNSPNQTALEKSIEISDQRKFEPPVEPVAEIRAAPQEDMASPPTAAIARREALPLPSQALADPMPDHAAMQQKPPKARRRHGGALPA